MLCIYTALLPLCGYRQHVKCERVVASAFMYPNVFSYNSLLICVKDKRAFHTLEGVVLVMGKPNSTASSSSGGVAKKVNSYLLKVPEHRCDFKGCGKYFGKLSRLKYHQNTHLKEKPYKCAFDSCTSAYYHPNHLKRHVETAHQGNPDETSKTHKCVHEGCHAAFETEASLYYHNKRQHSELPLRCFLCDKQFSKKWMLKEHEAGHTGATPFKCDFGECEEKFKDHKLFRAHLRSHVKKKEPKTYTCSMKGCNLNFAKWSELVIHRKSAHITETECPTCKKHFSGRNLKVHIQVHQEDRVSFQCPIDGCPRFYLHPKNLRHHMKIKHEDLGFECVKCGRKLSSKQKLNEHIQIKHKGIKAKKKIRIKSSKIVEKLLDKLPKLTDDDWTCKRTGPARVIRMSSCVQTVAPGLTTAEEADDNNMKQSEEPVLIS